jgi:hypothetical protein
MHASAIPDIPLIRRWPLYVVDHKHIYGSFGGYQFQSQHFLYWGECVRQGVSAAECISSGVQANLKSNLPVSPV